MLFFPPYTFRNLLLHYVVPREEKDKQDHKAADKEKKLLIPHKILRKFDLKKKNWKKFRDTKI